MTCRKKLESSNTELSGLPETVLDEHYQISRPSKELLYNRRKIMLLINDIHDMDAVVERCKDISEEQNQLILENQKRQSEITELQKTVSDLQIHLFQEREQVLRLYAENDRLKIRALQDRKKIDYLLRLTSMSEKELILICARPWRTVVPQKQIYTSSNKSSSSLTGSEHVSEVDIDALVLQNKALVTQLEEQTRLFEDRFHTLMRDRELQRKESSIQFQHSQEDIMMLSSQLNKIKKELFGTVKEMLVLKEERLKSELIRITENDKLARDDTRHSVHHIVKGDGNCGASSQKSKICEIRLLKDELKQRDNLAAMYQKQCELLEEQVSSFKKQLEAYKLQCKDHIEKLIQRINITKKKYNELDQRRRFDAEGFRNDIQILRTKLQSIERTLLKLNRSISIPFDEDILATACDTECKAKLLGNELLLIKKKLSAVQSKVMT